jgi:hypothetical protein
MRDILNKLETIVEAAVLSPAEIIKYGDRFNAFIKKIKDQSPFLTVADEEIIIAPKEANRFVQLNNAGQFKGAIKALTIDGQEIALSQLKKTADLGGQQGKAGEVTGKEALLVKPKSIQITDIDIPSHELYNTIKSNQVLNSTEYGKVIIQLADYIVSGEYIMLPEEYQTKEKQSTQKAIVDYAGEYLGVLALLYERSRFPRKQAFTEWLGGSTDDLVINFPGASNTNIADSYASIKNAATSHSLNISSKGTGGGAAPAVSGLKISDDIARNPEFSTAVEFINICKNTSAIEQAFDAMNLINDTNPTALNKKWAKWLPWDPNTVNSIIASYRSKAPLPKKFEPLFSDIATKSKEATQGGTLIYAVKKAVISAMNDNDAIPEFRSVILQVLEMNFIQQYCDYKGGEITFATQWPAKLDGNITVESKSSAVDPGSGGFSFKLGRTDTDVSSEPGEEEVDDTPLLPDVADVAQDITRPKRASELSKPQAVEPGAGRAKRK